MNPMSPTPNLIQRAYGTVKLTGIKIKIKKNSLSLKVLDFILKIYSCSMFYFTNNKHTVCAPNMINIS